jgi:hypothetical protein
MSRPDCGENKKRLTPEPGDQGESRCSSVSLTLPRVGAGYSDSYRGL